MSQCIRSSFFSWRAGQFAVTIPTKKTGLPPGAFEVRLKNY
jgi:hypothetical protein